MTPAIGSRFDSCDWRGCAPVFGIVVAADARTVTLAVGKRREKIKAAGFPHQRRGLFGRGGSRDWRMISAR